jgi:hypothetical protein
MDTTATATIDAQVLNVLRAAPVSLSLTMNAYHVGRSAAFIAYELSLSTGQVVAALKRLRAAALATQGGSAGWRITTIDEQASL